MEVPPSAHARSTRSLSAGGMLPGWWNSPRVVTMFVPAARMAHTWSRSQTAGMYSTQSAPSAMISSASAVAVTPVGGRPHRSPASRPALAAEVTYTPARVSAGCSMTWRSERLPMSPVAHCTTRSPVMA